MDTFAHIVPSITQRFNRMETARDRSYALHREVIRCAANAIRATHRGEHANATGLLDQAATLLTRIQEAVEEFPEVFYAGFIQDAQKEYAEACLTSALIRQAPIPHPDDLRVDYAAFLNGLAEAVGELRRHILDLLRGGREEAGEPHLQTMEEIYHLLASLDYPDGMTRGLRRSTDVARSLLEKTRGDLTAHISQVRLAKQMERAEARLSQRGT